ncbi:MAG: hypothetical protein SGPRY_012255, partial [Prymnesium sp.]
MALLASSFNQDHSHLAIGTSFGWKIFSCDPFSCRTASSLTGVSSIQMLFSSALVALVGDDHAFHFPMLPRLWNSYTETAVGPELCFPTTVLNVQMNRQRLIVVLESALHIFDRKPAREYTCIHHLRSPPTSPNCLAVRLCESPPSPSTSLSPFASKHTKHTEGTQTQVASVTPSLDHRLLSLLAVMSMQHLHTLPTSINPLGLASLCPDPETCYCATLTADGKEGQVVMYDARKLHALNTVVGHRSTLQCLSLSSRGDMLATASEKGTVVRVHSFPQGVLMYTFRRGSFRSVIHSVSFSPSELSRDGSSGLNGIACGVML